MSLSPYIAQCFIYGDSLKNACVSVVFPEEDAIKGWAAKDAELAAKSYADLCTS